MIFAATYADFLSQMVPGLLAVAFALASWISAQKAASLGQENKDKLAEVGKQFDGRLTQLLAETEKAQRALGITEGQDKERVVQRDDLATVSRQAREIVELAALKATELLKHAATLAPPVAMVASEAHIPAVLAVPAVMTTDGAVEPAGKILPPTPPEPPGELGIRKVRES